ncbi:MAG: hypothetical protein PHP45_09390, partial [Elusimicrobiales bacterium]|nr:hypothetical protein [Elusimicrobiales bacterium]
LTWKSPIRKNYGVAYGDKGLLEILDGDVALETPQGGRQVFQTGEKLSGGSAHPTWMAGLLADFAAELDDTSRRSENFREALACAVLTRQGYKSAKTGRPQKTAAVA